jgi:hypothetical protein
LSQKPTFKIKKGIQMLSIRLKFLFLLICGTMSVQAAGSSVAGMALASGHVDRLVEFELVPTESTNNPKLTQNDWTRIKSMNPFARGIFATLGQMSFPSSYFDLWKKNLRKAPKNNGNFQKMAYASHKLIEDYTYNPWWRLHPGRHFTNSPFLLDFHRVTAFDVDRSDDIEDIDRMAFDHILQFLNDVRVHVFPYPLFFGKTIPHPELPTVIDYFHEDDEVIAPYTTVRDDPGSLFARCRFILLKTLQELCQRISSRERNAPALIFEWLKDEERFDLLRIQILYYIHSPGISPQKKPGSLLDSGKRMPRESFMPGYLQLDNVITEIVLQNPPHWAGLANPLR